MILTTPLFREIKKLFPDSILTVLASDLNKSIAQSDLNVDKVYIYKKNIPAYLNLYFSSLKKQDLWIDTKNNYSRTSEFLLKFLNPKFSLGFNFSKPLYNIDLKNYQTGNHATEVNLSPVIYFTNENHHLNKLPELEISKGIKEKIDPLMISSAELKKIAVNVSAGSESRYLQKEKWVKIIEHITNKGNYCIYLLGLEKDRGMIEFILDRVQKYNVCYLKTENILETSEVIRKSNLTITPDTSIIHICSAFNIPVIGIYPDIEWNLEKFYPLSDIKEIVISGNENNIADVRSEQIINSFDRLNKLTL